MKAIEQCFHVVLFNTVYYSVSCTCTRWFSLFSLWMKPSVTIQMKATEQYMYFHLVVYYSGGVVRQNLLSNFAAHLFNGGALPSEAPFSYTCRK